MTFVDTNTSYGHWPFALLPKQTLGQFEAHLQEHQIERALVSRLETIFLPDPDRTNRDHIRACKRLDNLSPVPVLNLANRGCLQNLEEYRRMTEIKAVKLYPNFHNYSLRSTRVSRLTEYLAAKEIRLIINMRMMDERHQYHGLKIKGVSTKQIISYAKRFSEFPFLCTGLYQPEMLAIAEQCPQVRMDLSFADSHNLINGLIETINPEHLYFGSHAPLMVTKANTYKLETASIPTTLKIRIARDNAKAFFKL
ncbi:amidohydrolase family protein [Puniceicoccaceae bacterium K14]|nr:amidohydrolase family protein [Puniceicoccaceae bacterium K14]